MSESSPARNLDECFEAIQTAHQNGKLSESAVDNLKTWLTEPQYADYWADIEQHIRDEKWQTLDDVFWTIIPFGTGGRRGKMYPFGSNAINNRTIGESAQGLADYVKEVKPEGPWRFAIAYDTRHRSRQFAELCAEIMVANGFEVFFLNDYRSTPELSFLTRYRNCDCAIMVTASHNPPSDNAVKVYWSTGAQLIPPHDQAVIDKVSRVGTIPTVDFQTAVDDGRIHLLLEEVDDALRAEQVQHSYAGPRDLKILFSPLHGVGEFNVKSLLKEVGFDDVEIYGPHAKPDGDFPNVPGHVSNPERPEVFEAMIQHAQATGKELILATDPDADRMGAAAPMTQDMAGPWKTFTGNQLAVMLADYILKQRQEAQIATPDNFIVTTLVTTQMINRVCESYGVKCFSENLVGFKWICSVVDQQGPDNFVYGTEESHGFLVGQYCRDKDGAIACMLMSELAAWVKQQGLTLFDYLDQLYLKHGLHHEKLVNIQMEGSDGMKRMEALMQKFRTDPPASLGGIPVVAVRDYLSGKRVTRDGKSESFEGPTGNVLVLETDIDGNYIAARPSGTEPKVKFYMFTRVAPDQITDLAESKKAMEERVEAYAADMRAFADSIGD